MSRFSSRIALIGVGAVLFTAGIAGCGGSDDDSGDALSKEDFIAQANEICSNLTTDLDDLEGEFTTAFQEGDDEAAADVLADGNDRVGTALDELGDLTPPADDQSTIDQYLSVQDDQQELSTQLTDAVRDGDQATVTDLGDQISEIQDEGDQIADDYGMTECGSASDDSAGS